MLFVKQLSIWTTLHFDLHWSTTSWSH